MHPAEHTPATAPRAYAPSPHQARVLAFVEQGTGHAVVEATAGSGKTTTLVQVARLLPEHEPACFLAFNRATAAELRARLPSQVEATTIHALGRATLLRGLAGARGVTPDEGKYRALALALVRERAAGLGEAAALAGHLARLAGFARLELTDARDPSAVQAVAERYGLESPVTAALTPALHGLLPALLERGTAAARAGRVDFTDMVYLPVALRLAPPRFGFVCVDEAQDLSPLTLAFVLRLVEGGARAVFVGDPRQAIYAFAGADRRSLARVAAATGASVLPLSVSFRCPTRHVALARRFSPAMEPAPGAALGSLRLAPLGRLPRLARPGDLVMCRVNGPLVELCLRLTAAGTPARVLGADLAGPVVALARRLFAGRLPPDAEAVVARHAEAEARSLEQRLLTSAALGEALRRSREAHQALALLLAKLGAGRPRRLDDLERLARTLLVDDPEADAAPTPGVVLSTIHKAKGREAERVFLLFPEELAPRPDGGAPAAAALAEPPLDEEAEANVLFVALTRAKRELVLVERHPGAVAARVAAHRAQRTRPGAAHERERLPARWSEVLGLAALMARSPEPRLAVGRRRAAPPRPRSDRRR